MELLGLIVFGAVIGALARLFMKGEQPLGILATTVLGVLGTLAGYYLAGLMGVADTKGIDWIRWIISIICAMVFISLYLAITGRSKQNVNDTTIM